MAPPLLALPPLLSAAGLLYLTPLCPPVLEPHLTRGGGAVRKDKREEEREEKLSDKDKVKMHKSGTAEELLSSAAFV